MKRLVVTLLISTFGVLAAPFVSDAATRCNPVASLDTALTVTGAGCGLAERLERYVSTHESLDGSFFALKRQWLGAANPSDTKFVYDSPGWPTIEIRITSRIPHN
jgi:hypothetical protein